MRNRAVLTVLTLGLCAAAALPASGMAAGGDHHEWTVTTLADGPGANDAIPGDGICASADGVCTVRAATEESAHASYASDANHHIHLPAGRIDLASALSIFGAGTTELRATQPGATVLSGQNVHRVLGVPGAADVELVGIDVTQGLAAEDAGGLITVADGGGLSITRGRLTDGTARAGGAISAGLGSTLALEETVFEDNVATDNGGGAVQTSGSLSIWQAAFLRNSAQYGGAVFVLGSAGFAATVDIENVTFAGNTAVTNAAALRIDRPDAGDNADVRHVTFVGNTAGSGALVFPSGPGTGTFRALVFDANTGGGCFDTTTSVATASISDDATCTFSHPSSANATDPLLGPVALQGHMVPVAMPGAGSPALDRVSACVAATDARTFARITGVEATCDAGAAERILTDLRATLGAPGAAAPGEIVAFTAGLTSTMPMYIVPEQQFRIAPADGVEIVDFDAPAPGVPPCVRAGADVLCDIDESVMGAHTIGVRARRAGAGPLTLTVTATAATIEETPADNVVTAGPVVAAAIPTGGGTTAPGATTTAPARTPSVAAPVTLPRISRVTVTRSKRTGRDTAALSLSSSARVTVTLERRVRRAARTRYVRVTTITRRLAAGRRSIVLPAKVAGKRLAKGGYRITLRGFDGAGRGGVAVRKSFSVK